MTDQEKHASAFGYRAIQRGPLWYRQLYRLADPAGHYCVEQSAASESDAATPNGLHEWFVAPDCQCSKCPAYYRAVVATP